MGWGRTGSGIYGVGAALWLAHPARSGPALATGGVVVDSDLEAGERRSVPRELARVVGRESVAGPLQERLELIVEPGGLVIRRGRLLRALRGGREEKRIPFSSLDRVTMGSQGGATLVPNVSANVGPPRTLHGPAALVAVAAWWACLGRDDARLVGAAATHVGPLGLRRSGLALGGPAGVVFVPTGWVGSVDDTLVRIPIDAVQGVERSGVSTVRFITTTNEELHLDSAVASVGETAAWLARSLPEKESTSRLGGLFKQAVVWQVDEQGASLGVLSAGHGRLTLSSAVPDVADVSVAVGQVERIRLDLDSKDPVSVLRVGGAVHTLRPYGDVELLERLDALLQAGQGDMGLRVPDMKRWRALAGSHRMARLFRGAGQEQSLTDVSVQVTRRGMRLRGTAAPRGTGGPELVPGGRLRVSLPSGRGWQHFSASVRRVVHEVGDSAESSAVDLLLVPVMEGPQVGNGRRAFHRVEDPDQTSFVLSRPRGRGQVWLEATLLDLSAGGFLARMEFRAGLGSRFTVELPTMEWMPALEAEVIHVRAEGSVKAWKVGFRLLGITEKHRSQLQREVLRRERDALSARRRKVDVAERRKQSVRGGWAQSHS